MPANRPSGIRKAHRPDFLLANPALLGIREGADTASVSEAPNAGYPILHSSNVSPLRTGA